MTKCEFCQDEVEEPTSIDEPIRQCPRCGAIYWLEFVDDLYLTAQDAADYFEIEYEKMPEQIETKVVRNFDVLGEDKEEICLVFARKK